MLEARFLDPDAPEVQTAWANLWARSLQRSPFGTLRFARAIAEAAGLKLGMAGVFTGERLVAGVLLFEKRRGGLRLGVVPPFTLYSSPLLAERFSDADVLGRRTPLDTLLPLLDARFDALAFHLHPSLHDVRSFTWAGYTCSPLYTYRLKLTPDGLPQVSRKVRRQAASATDWRVEAPGVADGIGTLVGMVEASYARQQHRLPLAPERLARFAEHIADEGQLLVAYPANRHDPAGALLSLSDGTAGYDALVGSHPGPARTRLLFEMLRHLRDLGHEEYDFAGANTPSLAEFKRGFGGDLVPYFRAVRYPRAWARWIGHVRGLV